MTTRMSHLKAHAVVALRYVLPRYNAFANRHGEAVLRRKRRPKEKGFRFRLWPLNGSFVVGNYEMFATVVVAEIVGTLFQQTSIIAALFCVLKKNSVARAFSHRPPLCCTLECSCSSGRAARLSSTLCSCVLAGVTFSSSTLMADRHKIMSLRLVRSGWQSSQTLAHQTQEEINKAKEEWLLRY